MEVDTSVIIIADRSHTDWIVRHRVEMFRSMGWQNKDLVTTRDVTQSYLEEQWNPEQDTVFLIELDTGIVGGCAASNYQVLPDNRNPSGKCAYLLNMYIEPEHRGQGHATKLIQYIIRYCETKGIGKISLHDTEMSKDIYIKAGFVRSDNYYQLYL